MLGEHENVEYLGCELIKAVLRRLITAKEQMKVMANFLEIWEEGVARREELSLTSDTPGSPISPELWPE